MVYMFIIYNDIYICIYIYEPYPYDLISKQQDPQMDMGTAWAIWIHTCAANPRLILFTHYPGGNTGHWHSYIELTTFGLQMPTSDSRQLEKRKKRGLPRLDACR